MENGVSSLNKEDLDEKLQSYLEPLEDIIQNAGYSIEGNQYSNLYKRILQFLSDANDIAIKGEGKKDSRTIMIYIYKTSIIELFIQGIDIGIIHGIYNWYHDYKKPKEAAIWIKISNKEWKFHLPKRLSFVPREKLPRCPR